MAEKSYRIPDEQLFDVRLAERYIRDGKLDRKEYETRLKKLQDDAKNFQEIEVCEEPLEDQPTPVAEELTFT